MIRGGSTNLRKFLLYHTLPSIQIGSTELSVLVGRGGRIRLNSSILYTRFNKLSRIKRTVGLIELKKRLVKGC